MKVLKAAWLGGVSEAALAMTVAILGMVGVALGLSTAAHPFDIAPSLDGTLMAAQFGFVLAVLHGLRFRRVLTIMAPVLVVLTVAALRQGESVFALLGVTLVLYGGVGIAMSMVVPERADAASRAQAVRSTRTG